MDNLEQEAKRAINEHRLNHEHWDLDKAGKFAGLWDINAQEVTGADLWQKLDRVISEYSKIHPNEMRMIVVENKMISDSRRSDTQAIKSGTGLRWGISIPPALLFKLEMVEPELFRTKKLYHGFMRRYPGFRICKNV